MNDTDPTSPTTTRNADRDIVELLDEINLLRTLLRRLNAEVDNYWNSDRSDAQVKRISVVQQECKQHVG